MRKGDKIKYTNNVETYTPTESLRVAMIPMSISDRIKLWLKEMDEGHILPILIKTDSKPYIRGLSKKTIGSMSYSSGTDYKKIDNPQYDQTQDLELWSNNLEALIDDMVKENPLCTIDSVYMTYAEIVDNPNDINEAKIITFDKINYISDVEHPVRKALKEVGNEIMALDIGDVHDVRLNRETLIVKGDRLSLVREGMSKVPKGAFIVNARDVETYTKYIYPHMKSSDGHFSKWSFLYECPLLAGERTVITYIRDESQPCKVYYPIRE